MRSDTTTTATTAAAAAAAAGDDSNASEIVRLREKLASLKRALPTLKKHPAAVFQVQGEIEKIEAWLRVNAAAPDAR